MGRTRSLLAVAEDTAVLEHCSRMVLDGAEPRLHTNILDGENPVSSGGCGRHCCARTLFADGARRGGAPSPHEHIRWGEPGLFWRLRKTLLCSNIVRGWC